MTSLRTVINWSLKSRHIMVPFWSHDVNRLKVTHFRRQNDEGMLAGGVQLNGVQLSDVQLSGIQLSGVQLSDVQLSGAQLNGAQLDRLNRRLEQAIQSDSDWEMPCSSKETQTEEPVDDNNNSLGYSNIPEIGLVSLIENE
ncbi:hypothetical protein EAG_04879 [Camponotus floridanus]|uniref:Pentapeptide repeat-containing protein n=1 Tax=Camponotus floridanus TaxID=104421 RepID=E1ZX29_CAMFO|nr:hypothetical protein EAG_04879 [Camponotus floridanus]